MEHLQQKDLQALLQAYGQKKRTWESEFLSTQRALIRSAWKTLGVTSEKKCHQGSLFHYYYTTSFFHEGTFGSKVYKK